MGDENINCYPSVWPVPYWQANTQMDSLQAWVRHLHHTLLHTVRVPPVAEHSSSSSSQTRPHPGTSWLHIPPNVAIHTMPMTVTRAIPIR